MYLTMFYVILPTSRVNCSSCIGICSLTMTQALSKFPFIFIPEGVPSAKYSHHKPCVFPLSILQRICKSIYNMEMAKRNTLCLDTANCLRLETRMTDTPEHHLAIAHCIADIAEPISLFLPHV